MKKNKTIVVNLYKDPYDVYIGRAGRGQDGIFGNPFPDHNRAEAVANFRQYFAVRIEEDDNFRFRVLQLRGKRLGCFCSPKPCHGDVIAEWLNRHDE